MSSPSEELRDELLARYAADQSALKQSLKINERLGWGPIQDDLLTETERDDLAHTRRIQRENLARLRDIVIQVGWPDIAMVGEDGAEAAWLLAQHADKDVELQRRCLDLMAAKHAQGLVDPEHFAALTDRVALADGRAQVYGTQLEIRDGAWNVREPCDLTNAVSLRAQLGLPAIEAEIAAFAKRHPPL